MRAIIFLAIVGVAFGNLCKDFVQKDINEALATARVGSLLIFGESCPGFDFKTVALSGKCRSLVRQATCYGLNAASHYDSDVVNYGQLASDVSNMEELGNLACNKVEGCYEQVQSAIQNCSAANPNFENETIAAIEALYRSDYKSKASAFAEERKGSLLGEIATMAMNKFSSADDIRTFIEEQITEERKSDALEAYEQAKSLAQGWCDDGCTSSTARFLEGIFGHMNGGGGCDDVSVFCGECQSRAESYFAGNQLPCCVEEVVRKGIEAYNYVIDNYSDDLIAYRAAVEKELSLKAIAEAEKIEDTIVAEFNCVKEVYSAIPECA